MAALSQLLCCGHQSPSRVHFCRAEGVLGPHLVVVPLSTLANWAREFAAWAPDMNVVTLIGNPEARKVIKDHELYIHADQGTTFRDRRASAQVIQSAPEFCSTFENALLVLCLGSHLSLFVAARMRLASTYLR